jgi:hypothetical protein
MEKIRVVKLLAFGADAGAGATTGAGTGAAINVNLYLIKYIKEVSSF